MTPHTEAACGLDERLAAYTTRRAARTSIVDCARLHLAARQPPWQSTGLRVRAGQSYSVFAAGRVYWAASAPDLYGGPRFHLWLRVNPGGRIRNLRADTDTFVADVDGELEIGLYMGVWRDAGGALATDPALYARLDGGIDAFVIVWHDDPVVALAALAGQAGPDSAFAAELAHLRTRPALPSGWQPLLETGETHAFTAIRRADDSPGIRIHGDDEQGILCRACEFPLSATTRLTWSWKLDVLPSTRREDRARCHDYISLAAEFDDGRDLTWFWSSSLAPGHHFSCPVQGWTARETHFVVRTGTHGLGHWQQETRRVWDDVTVALGKPPARIVRIWLIAVASFQHGPLRAEFGAIELADGARRTRVL